jgi:hypothetical protein
MNSLLSGTGKKYLAVIRAIYAAEALRYRFAS